MSSSRQSTSSASTRSTRGGAHPAVESAVTRLLVSIKQLLEGLTKWSKIECDENHVSDVYVRLGNDFNAAVAAFGAFNIDMSEMMSVPDDLRGVLESCLAEDATPENLELYLPTVRQIITGLLQGLRNKQSTYRRIVSDHKHRSDQSGHDRTSTRSSRSHRKQASRTANQEPERDSISRRNGSAAARRRETSSSEPAVDPEGSFVGGFSPVITEASAAQESDSNDLPNPYETPQPSPSYNLDSPPQPLSPPPLPPQAPAVPPNVKRYSLVDKPVSPPPPNTPSVIVVEPSSPDPDQPDAQQTQIEAPTDDYPSPPPPAQTDSSQFDASQTPAIASSLAALKKSDALERRASKRFSTYNISKMTGSTSRDRGLGRNTSKRWSLAVSSALTQGELAVLTEVDDEETPPATTLNREGSTRLRRSASRGATPDHRNGTPPVPRLLSKPSRTPEPPETLAIEPGDSVLKRGSDFKLTVFLQLGREVKKASLEPGLPFSSLRMLFVDKFSYNPGQENFPAIYIRDPSSGVQYELEDMDEVKEKCLLSLNIEPLDQIKQHIDLQISGLSQEIKDLRSTVATTNHRQSAHIPHTMALPIAETTSTSA
ncbi:hypothetical protein D9757_015244, partial [Collybiopsis confluens]